MAESINVGAIQADLQVDSGNVVRGLSQGREALKAFSKELDTLKSAFESGGIAFDQYATRTNVIRQTVTELKTAMAAAYQEVGRLGDAFDVMNQKADAQNFEKSTKAQIAGLDKVIAKADALSAKWVDDAEKNAAKTEAESRKAIQAQIADLDKVIAKADAKAVKFGEIDDRIAAKAEEASRKATQAQIADLDKVIAKADHLAAKWSDAAEKQKAAAQVQDVKISNKVYQDDIQFQIERLKALEEQAKYDAAMMASIGTASADSATKGRAAYGGFGMAMMQFGYILDDVQYGFRAIANNMGPFAASIAGGFGASAAHANMFAGGVQIASSAVYMLYNHWDQLEHAMGRPTLKTASQEMEELAKKTEKTADETDRLNKLRDIDATAKHREESKPDLVEKSEKEADKAIAEAGGGKAVELGIKQALDAEGFGKLTENEERAAKNKANTPGMALKRLGETIAGGAPSDIHKRQEAEELAKARENKINDEVNRLMGDKSVEGRSKLKALTKNHPEFFKPGFAKDLDAAEPAAVKAKELEKAKEKMDRAEYETDRDARKAYDRDEKNRRTRDDASEKASRKQNIDVARSIFPGFDKDVEDMAGGAVSGRKSKASVIEDMTAKLAAGRFGNFMHEEDAREAAKDTVGKKFDEFTNDPDKLKTHKDKVKRDLAHRAEEAIPDLKEQVVGLTAQAAQAQAGTGAVKSVIAKALRDKGFSAEDADEAAGDAAKSGKHDLGKKLTRDLLHGREHPNKQHMMSEIYNANDITSRGQAAIGGNADDLKQQTGYQKTMVDYLKEISDKQPKGVLVSVT